MFEEQPKRRQRIPLSAEELFYFKKLKLLKQAEKLESFKKTRFYRLFNSINITLCACIAYYIFSVLFACNWQSDVIRTAKISRKGGYSKETQKQSITEVEVETMQGKSFVVKTDLLFIEPEASQQIFIGKDFLFNLNLKTKFSIDEREFWNFNTYPSFTVCCFSLLFGLGIYKINRHVSVNGLLVVFGLYFLACLYFLCI